MKPRLIAVCTVICMAAHAELVRAELIDFDDLVLPSPGQLLVTDQYQHLGVLFSGEGEFSGLVYPEGSYGTANFGNSSPNIMDMGLRGQATVATFVIPGTITPTVATNVSVLTGDGHTDEETFTVESFDINGNTLFSHTYTTTVAGELIEFSGEVASIRFVVATDSFSGACFDDLCFTVIPASVVINIDIMPGGIPNSINLRNKKGVTPVALLGSDDLDVTDVDPSTIMLEGVPALRWAIEDVPTEENPQYDPDDLDSMELIGDGHDDLIFHFGTPALRADNGGGLDGASTEATLTGETLDGIPIEATDSVNIIAY